jgi:hypothetical protein
MWNSGGKMLSNCARCKITRGQYKDVRIVATSSDIEWVAGKKVNYDLCYFSF